MILLDGIQTSNVIASKLLSITTKKKLKLSVILVGDNPSSVIYVNAKKKKCVSLGVDCEILNFDNKTSEEKILNKIKALNKDISVTGILVQLPLPKSIGTRKILDSVDINKDVDGLNSFHLTKTLFNEERVVPCTPKGVISLLEAYNILLKSKKVTIVGFSDVVGKPLSLMCINRGATITVCNSKTQNLSESTLRADIIMSATGIPHIIKKEHVKQGAVVIDIGSSKIDGKITGDVDFENVKGICSYITPVPGGVGPMTIISLVENLILLDELQKKANSK